MTKKNEDLRIDPWGTTSLMEDDYFKLIKEFGIQEMDEKLRQKFINNRFIRRKVIFGHRDLELVVKAIDKGERWAVMSGIKPSGPYHLGTLTTASEIVEFQRMGAKAYYCVADIESWEDNGIPYKEAEESAIDNLADVLALGLDPSPEKAYIWRQSEEPIVKDICFKVSRLVTHNMLNAIYGEKTFGLYISSLVQCGDILLPQVLDGLQPTIVPVGIDQDPHIRLTRDLTRRYYKDFFLPGATYHYLLKGIDGSDKMAKRNPNSSFTFDEPLESIERKIKGALTGGRKNKKEQQELGGEPKNCMVYKMLMYHFEEDDSKLTKSFQECIQGTLMCGDHKKECIEKAIKRIKEHRKKKEKLIDKARELLQID